MPKPVSSRPLARVLAALALPLLVSTCTCEGATPSEPKHLDLDTILGPGEVRCGPVIRESELIGGPQAYAQVGRAFRCHNNTIRFIVQDSSRPAGNSVEGGNLIDIDLVRGDEFVDGEDTFREYVSALGAQEAKVSSIEILNDGTDGKAGIIRVRGTPSALSLAPQAAFLSQDLVGELVVDYRLAPDTNVIEIETTFENAGDTLFGGLGADVLASGGATPLITPETGFGEFPSFGSASFLVGARGEKVNVAFVCDGKDLTIPVVTAGVTVPICENALVIGSEGGFKRFILVGDGSVESVASQAFAMRGIATGTITGTVAGAIEGTLVAAIDGTLDRGHLVNEARVDADGRYTLTVPADTYSVVAHRPDLKGQQVGRSAVVEVDVVAGANVSADLTLGQQGRISVQTDFGDGVARAAKLTLVGDSASNRGTAVLGDSFGNSSLSRYDVSADGTFDVTVPPGNYIAYVTRGFEWSRFEQNIVVTAGGSVTVAASIVRVLDTTGFVAGEFHQHTLGSLDSVVPVPLKVLENAAEGIEVAVSTDHDNISDFRPHVEALGLTGQMVAFAGNEVSYQAIGHFNAYPWTIDDADPFKDIGSSMWWLKTLPEMFADIRAASGDDIIIQLNHPRSSGTGSLASLLFDPTNGARNARDAPRLPTLPPTIYDRWSPAFDAIEVNTNLGDVELYTTSGRETLKTLAAEQSTSVPVLADWFGLMMSGLPIAAMGNSDTHSINEGVGYPRTYLFVGDDDPNAVTEDVIRKTVRAQKTTIAQGCLLTLEADGVLHMGAGDVVDADADITLRLQAPLHVTVGRLEVYVNGVVQSLAGDATALTVDDTGSISLPLADIADAGSVERLKPTLTLANLAGDAVVVAVSRGGNGLAPTGGNEVVCVSPVLYLDGDGDGAFTPPLAATEEVTTER